MANIVAHVPDVKEMTPKRKMKPKAPAEAKEAKEAEVIGKPDFQFVGQFKAFQQGVFRWSRGTTRGILGLDMGLGKTPVTIAIMADKGYERTIIVSPLAIVDQWLCRLQQFSNLKASDIGVYHGPKRGDLKLANYRVILTTYDIVRMDMKNPASNLSENTWLFDGIVLDEAHIIRNKSTQAYLTCFDLGAACRGKWLLTGTAIYNKFDDIQSLADFLAVPDFNTNTLRDPAALAQWKKTYYVRMTKIEVSAELPDKKVTEHFLGFDGEHQGIYDEVFYEMKQVYKSWLAEPTHVNFGCLLAKILRLRQCCNHPDAMLSPDDFKNEQNHYASTLAENGSEQDPLYSAKFGAVLDILAKAPPTDKILIFSQWTHSLKMLGRYLTKHGYKYLSYNGDMNKSAKDLTIEQLRTGDIRIMFVSIQSGGCGLDLNFTNHVVVLDSWWNQALESQAIDRAHRLGQSKTVYVHQLYMKGTIEEWVYQLKKEKGLIGDRFHNQNLPSDVDKRQLAELLQRYTRAGPDFL